MSFCWKWFFWARSGWHKLWKSPCSLSLGFVGEAVNPSENPGYVRCVLLSPSNQSADCHFGVVGEAAKTHREKISHCCFKQCSSFFGKIITVFPWEIMLVAFVHYCVLWEFESLIRVELIPLLVTQSCVVPTFSLERNKEVLDSVQCWQEVAGRR